MGIKSKEELINAIRGRIGDASDDETLTFLEDVTDTLNDFENKANNDGTEWKAKYEENDKKWRKTYRDRFFKQDSNEPDPEPDPEPKKYSYADLFKEE